MNFGKRFMLVIVLMAAITGTARIAVAAEDSGDDDTLLTMIQPYLEKVRPWLAPIEEVMREQAEAFKTFVKDNMSSTPRRGTSRVVIDLPPPPSR